MSSSNPEPRAIKSSPIDDGIWPIVRWLNSFDDVVTLWSCQGGGDGDVTNSHAKQPYVVFLCACPVRLLEILQFFNLAGKMEVELYSTWSNGRVSRNPTQLRYHFKFAGQASLNATIRKINATVRWEHRRLTRLLADDTKEGLAKIQHQIDVAAAMDAERRAKEEQAAKEPVIKPVFRDIKRSEVDYHERDLSPVYDIGDLRTKIELPPRTSATFDLSGDGTTQAINAAKEQPIVQNGDEEFWQEAERVANNLSIEAPTRPVTLREARQFLTYVVACRWHNGTSLRLERSSAPRDRQIVDYLDKKRLINVIRAPEDREVLLLSPSHAVVRRVGIACLCGKKDDAMIEEVVSKSLPEPLVDDTTLKGVLLPPGLADQTLTPEAAQQLVDMLDNPSENAATGAPLESGDPLKIKPC